MLLLQHREHDITKHTKQGICNMWTLVLNATYKPYMGTMAYTTHVTHATWLK
jgi:hypothetical protein